MKIEKLIKKICKDIEDLLLEKNRDYGDSALNPSSIFSQGDVFESLGSRIDDKLMRIKNVGVNYETEDTISDLIGYLILYKVALVLEENKEYEGEREIIEDGGHVTIDGRTMSSIEDLDYYYSEKKEKNGN